VSVFAIKGEDNDTYYAHIEAAVDHKPHFTMDDGADVIGVLHSARRSSSARSSPAPRRRRPA
jgi:S-adenosylhomocysteine hydrolase